MELSVRIQASDVDEADREALGIYLDQIVNLLGQVGYTPAASLVLAEREDLEVGEFGLSKLGGVYSIFHGAEVVGEFFDEKFARTVFEGVKSE